jgi:hypothetical protein
LKEDYFERSFYEKLIFKDKSFLQKLGFFDSKKAFKNKFNISIGGPLKKHIKYPKNEQLELGQFFLSISGKSTLYSFLDHCYFYNQLAF